jgi:hypothetical protein
MVHGLFFSTTQKHKGTLFLSQNGPRNGPPFRIGQSAFTRLIPLHLTIKNPHIKKIHIYYISSLFYHGFAIFRHTFSYHLHIIAIIHSIFIYQASLHLCRGRDTRTRGGWAGDRGRRHPRWKSREAPMHLFIYILDQWSIWVLLVHELLYVDALLSLFRILLSSEYAWIGVTN